MGHEDEANAAGTSAVTAEVAAGGAADSGVAEDYLGDFLGTLSAAVVAGEPISAASLRAYRHLGERAARDGVALRALLDLYLSAAWRLWRHLPPVADAARYPEAVVVAGEVMLHAVDDAVAELAEGYQLARRSLERAQESARREFVDDLLNGSSDVVSVLNRAHGFGLDLAGPHCVVVVAAERTVTDAAPIVAALERAMLGRRGDAAALIASKDGRLVVVFAAPDGAAIEHVLDRLAATFRRTQSGRTGVGTWRLGVGRPRPGADGVVSSFREAADALDLAARLGVDREIVDSRDLLVYQLLMRDRPALGDVVESVLGPLRGARGGAQHLIDTLAAWFDANGNNAAAARSLNLSVRAVTYRLARIAELTGLDVDDPDDRLSLHVAALGSRLLGGLDTARP